MKKTALITGAAGGIGRALCRAFARESFRVVGLDRTGARVAGCAAFLAVDLERFCADEDYRESSLDRIRAEIPKGGLTALVNNAAVQILNPTEKITAADWTRTLSVNLVAPFLLAQGLLAELERARGTAIQIASVHAKLTKPGFVCYATSKAALIGLTKALAVDLGAKVRVNAISPAATDTPMLRAGLRGRGALARLNRMHPAGRIAGPDEIARTALFLASDGARFMTGAVLEVDGAISSRLHDPE